MHENILSPQREPQKVPGVVVDILCQDGQDDGTSFLEGCRMSRQSINEASLQLIMVDGTVSTTNIIAGVFVGFASSGLAYILRDTMYPNELTALVREAWEMSGLRLLAPLSWHGSTSGS